MRRSLFDPSPYLCAPEERQADEAVDLQAPSGFLERQGAAVIFAFIRIEDGALGITVPPAPHAAQDSNSDDRLITKLEERMTQRTQRETIFTIRWKVE